MKYLSNVLFRIYAKGYDMYACRRFNLSTFPPISKDELLERNKFEDNNGFMAAYLCNVRSVMRKISSTGMVRNVIDIGSGDGRLLKYICKSYREVNGLGIEIDDKLFQYSIKFNSGKNCNYINANALDVDLVFSEDTVIFIFNSFGERSIIELVGKLIKFRSEEDSSIYLAYINHIHKSTLTEQGLELLHNWGNRKMSLWKI